jgi:hypothetical protein
MGSQVKELVAMRDYDSLYVVMKKKWHQKMPQNWMRFR